MQMRWYILGLGITAVLSGLGFEPVTYHRARPRYAPGLPNHDYVHGQRSQPASMFSLEAVTLEHVKPIMPGAPGTVARDRLKYYQMPLPVVQRDHCSLSHVVLTLHERGEWVLSMRAHQNPWMTGPEGVISAAPQLGTTGARPLPIPTLDRETESLKRNQFFVRIRCHADFKVLPPEGVLTRPVLFELPTAVFWVQRGQPFSFYAKEWMPEVRRHFDLIDRVEVEFTYR